MSYILEALKKAQAERQLGSTPTIHAMPIHAGPAEGEAVRRKPLWIALAGAVTVAGAAAVFLLRPSAPKPVAPQPVQIAAAPAPAVIAPVPAPVAAAPAPVPKPAPVKAAPVKAPPPKPVAAAKPAAPKPAAEESLPGLRQLPDAVQREVPQVAIGGYIYSANPADRLLLVDKMLRREGDEVAPGLVLEKLMPKAAVMNYRGYRYRVAY